MLCGGGLDFGNDQFVVFCGSLLLSEFFIIKRHQFS